MTRRIARDTASAVASAAAVAFSASASFAQEDAAESRSATFQAVEGGKGEQVPGGPLLVYAYAAILVLLVAYVARLGSLYAKNRSELERLSRTLERGRKA
jgi:hypothetical protein